MLPDTNELVEKRKKNFKLRYEVQLILESISHNGRFTRWSAFTSVKLINIFGIKYLIKPIYE